MFINIINASIAATWLILAVAILRLLLKKTPRWITCLLWGLAGLRLVLPFSVRSIFSLIPSAQTMPPTIAQDAVPQIDSGVPAVNNSVNPILAQHFTADPQYSANPMQILLGLAESLWIVGVAAMVLYLLVSCALLRFRMRTATRLEGNVVQSERVTSPFVMGIFRPRIYLPYGLEDSEQEYIIAHERAHIARGDHLIKPLAFLVLTVHWFNPFVWLGYILLCRDIELACDQRVIKDMDGAGRKDYSRTLVRCGTRRLAVTACPLAFGEVGIKARVRSVLSYKKPALWIIVAAAIVCVATALCFLTDPVIPPTVFGRFYEEQTVVYHSPLFSSTAIPGRQYRVSAESHSVWATDRWTYSGGQLAYMDADGTMYNGVLMEYDLTPENFDDLFLDGDSGYGWTDRMSAAKLRRQNRTAWRAMTGKDMCCILLQKNGDIYIASGQSDLPEGVIPSADDWLEPTFTRVALLKETSDSEQEKILTALNTACADFVLSAEYGETDEFPARFSTSEHTVIASERYTSENGSPCIAVYALVNCEKYDLWDGAVSSFGGFSDWIEALFEISPDGEYNVLRYSLRSSERKECFGNRWDPNICMAERQEICYRRACKFFGESGISAGGRFDSGLEKAVNEAAVDYNSGKYLSGNFKCASNTILGAKTEQLDDETQLVTAYTIVLYQEFSLSGGQPEEVSGSSCPVAVTFRRDCYNSYTLVEYWEPRDGTLYAEDLRKMFPPDVPWNTQISIDERMAENYRKACQYFGVPMQTTTSVEDMPAPTTTAVVAGNGQPEERTRETYIYQTGEDLFGPCELTVAPDGTVVLTFGYLSSYIAVGNRVESPTNTLFFVTEDGYENKYCFTCYGRSDSYYFIADESTPVPKFRPSADAEAVPIIPDGAEFIKIY